MGKNGQSKVKGDTLGEDGFFYRPRANLVCGEGPGWIVWAVKK